MTKEEITNRLNTLGIKYCFNEQKYDNSQLKFIIVGDNPGKKEYEEKKFFIGDSGQKLRKHFLENNLIDSDFDKECMLFNKTIIYTPTTEDLREIKKNKKDLFDEIQSFCAREIANTANELKLPILIFGKSEIKRYGIFKKFWRELNIYTKNKKSIFAFNHPSRSLFKTEWNNNKEKLTYESNIDLLKQIGRNNTKEINEDYEKKS